ncbi:hypothetical protein [Roseomonas sp. BN140053]|uniref:hypothetical protein n=1 Tax=Roseomonas sp. BN140053 TaxID=3391898 RepID=UPI0039EACBDB
MSDNRPWRPTGGKDSILEMRLNAGLWNGNPIYIHVTSHEGLAGINKAGLIAKTPKKDRRGNAAKAGIYLNPSLQAFGPADALTLLFFDNETYRASATNCIVFSFLNQPGASWFKDGFITEGSWVKEIIYLDDIPFKNIDILYRGPNPFVELRHQNHPNPTVREAFRSPRSI